MTRQTLLAIAAVVGILGLAGAAHEITAINGVRNGAAGRWVHFVDDVRSPYHIDSQSSENVKAIRFAYEKKAPH